MKVSRVMTSVLHEPWLIMPGFVDAHLPMIAAWFLGNEIKAEEKGQLEVQCAFAGGISPGRVEDIVDFPDGSVAIVNLKGEMTKYDGWCNYGTNAIGGLVKMLALSKNISGAVLDIDGPGGAVSAVPPMVESMQFFKSRNKPLGVHADLMGSAHYAVGCHGDYVMMDNSFSSRAGSIGTMAAIPDYSKQLENYGVKLHTIYSNYSKHKNEEVEQLLESGNQELYKANVLDPLALKFQQMVRTQRGSKLNEQVEGLLSGSMFFAEDAVANGLADGIGTLTDTIEWVLEKIEIQKFMSR